MKIRFHEQNIKELLHKNGWEVLESQRIENLWVAEIWRVCSTYSPTNLEFYLQFTSDFQLNEQKFDEVDWMSAMSEPPAVWTDDTPRDPGNINEGILIAGCKLGRNQEKYFEEFFRNLAEFRNRA